jgi:glycosyltransferase involved in cell wall biosynthesis
LSTITNNSPDAQTTARAVSHERKTTHGQHDKRPPLLAVVVPCFDEEPVVRDAAARLAGLLARLVAAAKIDPASFVYFVDDGSRDRTWGVIAELHRADPNVKGLKLARNVGAQNAVLAGLLSVRERADCAVTIDADLQQDERVVETFLERFDDGAQIVYGVRRNYANESALKRVASGVFYRLMRLMDARIIPHHSECRLVSRKAIDAVAQYPEYNIFLRGIFVDIGFKSEIVPFDVRRREAGKSKHGFKQLVGLALDGITSFSVAPLRLVTIAGALVSLFSGAMALYYLWERLAGRTPPGWAGTIIPVYFLGGVQIMSLGVVGEYVGKIYKEVKARPRYIKDEELF